MTSWEASEDKLALYERLEAMGDAAMGIDRDALWIAQAAYDQDEADFWWAFHRSLMGMVVDDVISDCFNQEAPQT